MATGTVKWFMAEKHIGVINPDAGSEDLYVHDSAVEGAIDEIGMGTRVAFDVHQEQGRRSAINVKRLEQEAGRARRRQGSRWSR